MPEGAARREQMLRSMYAPFNARDDLVRRMTIED